MAIKYRKGHMLYRLIKSLFISLLFISLCFAGDIDSLINWKPNPKHPGMILPVLKGETPKQAIKRYRESIYRTPDLMNAMKKQKISKEVLSGDQFSYISIDALKSSPRPSFLLMANKFDDYTHSFYRIWDFIKPVSKHGGVSHLLPISVDASLSKNQAQEFRDLVANTFDSLFGMGGEDVNPEEYGEKLTYSNAAEVVPTRDRSEIKMIQTYMHKKRGVYYGICRGSQICYVAKGGQLKQDIFKEGVTSEHVDVWHDVKVVKDDLNLMRAFVGKDEVSIYSYHHQANREVTAEVSINCTSGVKQVLEVIHPAS